MSAIADLREVSTFIWKHPANRGQRVRQLYRAAAYQTRARALGRRTLSHIGKAQLWSELHFTSSSRPLYANPPDWPEMLVWERYLRPGDLFIDVGANIGLYTLWAAQLGAAVIAVEPDEEAYRRLVENIALNSFEVDARRVALLERSGSASLTSSYGAMNFITPDGAAEAECSEVTVTTLDGLLGERVAAGVKVDVEGTERLVVSGALRALGDKRVRLLQLEWNTRSLEVLHEDRKPLADLLRSHGYTLYRPNAEAELVEIASDDFGADVFAAVDGVV